jgi:hypothetical protein
LSHQAADSFCLPSEYSPTGINFQEGGYSFVFFTGTVATKIFRCDNALEPFIKRTFNSEVEAYIKVQNYPELRKITPKFLGPIKFNTLIDNNEKYPSKQILMPAYAYQMEYVSAPFIKLIQHPQCDAITKQFLDAGICHLKDASVTDPSPIGGNNEIGVRVIDFSIEEHILQQEDLVRTDL